ncbi:enoyl-CoA hydratase-related protein [Herbiconiux sp. CPCC 205763]|uniref:Enoyl-CoA hydratase-related protein n=1 Tax=Herbiconiux aconitum TaxID=2970913 RepID=A0ABT2GNJ4_9MICO|nr:enoyl-CoA hydratase-related protein [Herbiconiux aconitum]MCS5717785.1 enoyl-CoA hydratase-related protein [Herbiconiux aconitum]
MDDATQDPTRMAEVPLTGGARITIERRGHVVLIGINRPDRDNRFDPDAYYGLAKAYYDFDNDPSLRVAVVFGHGRSLSRGVDVDAFNALTSTGQHLELTDGMADPFFKSAHLSKPLVFVAHGDTWNMGHELFLTADIRVASQDVEFGQDETTHARFPGGGGTIRFPREVGWASAMRYILTGDHWGADQAERMGMVQFVESDREAAIAKGIEVAEKVAACAPLGIKTSLESAHLAIDESEAAAFAKLDEQYGALYRTDDFAEGRRAEAEGRPPVYSGR